MLTGNEKFLYLAKYCLFAVMRGNTPESHTHQSACFMPLIDENAEPLHPSLNCVPDEFELLVVADSSLSTFRFFFFFFFFFFSRPALPQSFELTRKDRLYKNIEKMQHSKGVKHFDFIPQTFVMPMDFREFCSTHYRLRGPWIVKPVASSRGRGIYIVNSPDQVPLEDNIVVMKYVDNPLLIDGHKCDLRLYVAVTSYDPLMVYMYEEGLVRFAAVKYDMSGKHLWNPCMHLCNYSINKYHSDYVKSEDPDVEDVGHKWTLSALLRHLRANGQDTSLLMTRIEEVVVKSVLASSPAIVSACRMFVPHARNCFERKQAGDLLNLFSAPVSTTVHRV
uniref:Tubulin--tyrosine ligase-like protein 5 n=1 Tax=Timema bartmani TaxID=61472 RepID=A0A7R9EM87_9NEOP|nr:unnamed protein product [Timema bartmani]